jgi:hypothetical protein
MKQLFILFSVLSVTIFALSDTDADGVLDEKDICPRVYSRSENGCPTLVPSKVPAVTNKCLLEQLKKGKMITTVSPLCDQKTTTCATISKVVGFQSCDPIFPIIFDKNGVPIIR